MNKTTILHDTYVHKNASKNFVFADLISLYMQVLFTKYTFIEHIHASITYLWNYFYSWNYVL